MFTGIVETVGRIVGVDERVGSTRIRIASQLPVAEKGSVAMQGVSLTVAALDSEGFEVALVPQTLKNTTLGQLGPGDRVNVEVDLVARYLGRLLEASGAGRKPPGDASGEDPA
jgi:riboflavin synthase